MITLFTGLEFRAPLWMLLVLLPLLIWVIRLIIVRSKGCNYAEPELLPWAKANSNIKTSLNNVLKSSLQLIGWGLLCIALAGPRTALNILTEKNSSSPELMLVIDVSKSMQAQDIEPGRLDHVKTKLQDLIIRSKNINIGITLFAAMPHLLVPPTSDKNLLLHYIQIIKTGLLPTEGSDLGAALRYSATHFSKNSASRSMMVISDGGLKNNNEQETENLYKIAESIKHNKTYIYSLGVGTEEGIQLYSQEHGWLRHQEQAVISRLNAPLLKRIAAIGHGKYEELASDESDLISLYDNGILLHRLSGRVSAHKGDVIWQEHFSVFLIIGCILLVLSNLQLYSRPPRSNSIAAILVLIVFTYPIADVLYASNIVDAYTAYKNKDFSQAKKQYSGVTGYQGRMGEGNSEYQLGKYKSALRQYSHAILLAKNDVQRANALFNLANTYYKLDQFAVAETIYRDVLRYRPDDSASIINLEYAIALKKDSALAQPSNSRRRGRGPATTTPDEDADISQRGITLGENTPKKPNHQNIKANINSNKDMIDKGIFVSEFADDKKVLFDDRNWEYENNTAEQLHSSTKKLVVDESIFWKRLFETEENHPAPLESPLEIPGTQPW